MLIQLPQWDKQTKQINSRPQSLEERGEEVVDIFLSWNLYHSSYMWAAGKGLIMKDRPLGVPVVVQWKGIWLVSMRMQIWFLALLSRLGSQHCHELWFSLQMQLRSMLLWLWCRLIQPWTTWEFPYAAGLALKSQKKKKTTIEIYRHWYT